jgi:AbrB family looped-hinge helix DNA binding protein
MKCKLKIDKSGRIALPKSVRKKLQIDPGDTLEAETEGEEIRLRLVRGRARTRKKRGIWVFRTGKPLTAKTVEKLIQDARKERDDHVALSGKLRNRSALEANDRFERSGGNIKDVYGNLDD